MNKHTYQYIEDNGGGLYLFVFDANEQVVDGIGNLEYAQPGEWTSVRDELNANPLDAISTWDGHISNAADVYEEFRNDDFGSKVVADQDGIRPASMGNAAQIYFGITAE